MEEWITQLQSLSEEYNFRLEDVPDIMEEYILIDNEVIENKNIENIIKQSIETERTTLGRNVLRQLLESLE